MEEIWKPIKDFETYCEISNLGNVRSLRTGKLRKLQIHTDGYYCLIFFVNKLRHTKYIHRLIAEAFIPNPDNKPEINHIDGNKKNNNILNLEWCTHKENIDHAYNNNLIKINRGENKNNHKLTDNDVILIRSLNNIKQIDIAKKFNISTKTIRDILNNKTWKHLL